LTRKFLAEGLDRRRQIVAPDGHGPQTLYCIPPLRDRVEGIVDRNAKGLLGLDRASRQELF
jgi:hypothetical protein